MPKSISASGVRENPHHAASNRTHNNDWKGRKAGQKPESWSSLQGKQQGEENRIVEDVFRLRHNPEAQKQYREYLQAKGHPRQMPARMDPFPETGPNSKIFENGTLSGKTAKRLFSWDGLKAALYGHGKWHQAYHGLKSTFTSPEMLSGEDISILNPAVYNQHVKIPTAETQGQPDSHAGCQPEPKKSAAWERPLEFQKPSGGTSSDVQPKTQAPIETKQEKSVERKWNLPLPGASASQRREWSDYADENELELRPIHQERITQQNAVAKEATREFQTQQFNTTDPSSRVMQPVASGRERQSPTEIRNEMNIGTASFQDSGAVTNSSLPIVQDHIHTHSDQMIEKIWNLTITRDHDLTGQNHHHRVRHRGDKLNQLDREIGRHINRWVKAVCEEYIKTQQQASVSVEKCDGGVAKQIVRESVLRHLIKKDPEVEQLSKAEQNLKVSQFLVNSAYRLGRRPGLQKRQWVFKPLQEANKPLLDSALQDVQNAFRNSTGVEPSTTTIPSTTESHNSTIASGNKPLQTAHSTLLDSAEQFEVIPPFRSNETWKNIMEQKLSNFKNLTQGSQFTEEGASTRLSGTLSLIRYSIEKWEQGAWEDFGSPLQTISAHIQSWFINLRADYRRNQAQQPDQLSAKCDEVCTAELVRNDVEHYLIQQDPNVANQTKQEKDILISKFLVDLAYTPLHENIIAKYQEQLKNGTVAEARQLIQQTADEQWQLEELFTDSRDQNIFRNAYLDEYAPFLNIPDINQIGNFTYGSSEHVHAVVGMKLSEKFGINVTDSKTCICVAEQIDRFLYNMTPGAEKDKLVANLKIIYALVNGDIKGYGPEIQQSISGSDIDAKEEFMIELISNNTNTNISPYIQKLEKIKEALIKVRSEVKQFFTLRDFLSKKLETHTDVICGRQYTTAEGENYFEEQHYTGVVSDIVVNHFAQNEHPNRADEFYCKISGEKYTQADAYKEYAQNLRDSLSDLIRIQKKDLLLSIQLLFGNDNWAPTTVYVPKASIRQQPSWMRRTAFFPQQSSRYLEPKGNVIKVSNGDESRLLFAAENEVGFTKLTILSEKDANSYILSNKKTFFDTQSQEPIQVWVEPLIGTPDAICQQVLKNTQFARKVDEEANRLLQTFHHPPLWRYFVGFAPFGSCVLRALDAAEVTNSLDRSQLENILNDLGCAIDVGFALQPIAKGVKSLASTGIKTGSALAKLPETVSYTWKMRRFFSKPLPLIELRRAIKSEKIVMQARKNFIAGINDPDPIGFRTSHALSYRAYLYTAAESIRDILLPALPIDPRAGRLDHLATKVTLGRTILGAGLYCKAVSESQANSLDESSLPFLNVTHPNEK